MKAAALCAGYGGLEMGLAMAGVDIELAWCAEIDNNAAAVMAARHPSAPNLGDLTQITDPPAVDIVTAGFPCQPVSMAGNRKGIHDERWLIEDVCQIASRAGAHWLILENVAGLLSANDGDAMARVVSALAQNGFDAEWTCVRASDVGAPHGRLRWFCVADADGTGLQGRPTLPERGRERLAGPSHLADRWGPYADAIARWAPIVERPAPEPTDDKRRLNPRFVEWMMGLPDGWVTDVIDKRGPALKCLGNGVVPQQAAYAIGLLIEQMGGDT